jgi:hypothetical protein
VRLDRTRIGKWVRVVAALTLGLSMLSAQPARAAVTKIPLNVSVVYLTGTYSGSTSCMTTKTTSYFIDHALDVKWLHRRLVKELGVDTGKSFSLNYYCPQAKPAQLTRRYELPAVAAVTEMVAVTTSGKPVVGCLAAASTYVESGQADTGKTKTSLPEPVIRHAYHVAWWLNKQVKDNPGRQFLLVGHSQGGILMRLIYILSEQSRRAAIAGKYWLEGRYKPECWPNLPKNVFYGNIFMGTPFNGGGWTTSALTCGFAISDFEICDIMDNKPPKSVTRRILEQFKDLPGPWLKNQPIRQIQLGGFARERAGTGTIDSFSSTALPDGDRLLILQKRHPDSLNDNLDYMQHADWFNADPLYAGQCPRDLDGYCAFTKLHQMVVGESIKNSDTSSCSGCPGNVYDLIITTIKKKW